MSSTSPGTVCNRGAALIGTVLDELINEPAFTSQALEFTLTVQLCQTTIIEATRSAKP